MASERLNVSVTDKQLKFLEENPDFSPSKLLQNKLNEIMETSINFDERLKQLNTQIQRLTEHRNKFIDFLNSKNLMDEFSKWN